MNQSSKLLIFLITFYSFSVISSSTAAVLPSYSNGTTVYEILNEFGLPSGLLPNSVKNFSIDEDGKFIVELKDKCYIEFSYLTYYDRVITGVLKYGSIRNPKGIQVRKFLVWLDVDEIRVDLPPANFIYFHVGWINKKLEVKQFQTIRSCQGDGFSSIQRVWFDLLEVPAPMREIPILLTE
ncbi:hypothetical protein C5167_003439 [Papaver somniferum]|uniref:DUF538 domain-containing protein n=1 Tax=Papaver somniferum TaxID=3469 RepID=A0A4Y7L1Y2_PAPSO|nr:uncharacterized protein LOC113308817 [Papaver somniferum]RZC79186.1 hypothetical protein C5167_003439 [Papaver somniferum]